MMAKLMRYDDGAYVREASDRERYLSIMAAEIDGGAGVIRVSSDIGSDIDCYVEPMNDDPDFAVLFQRQRKEFQ
jgi:hypothetical protein